MNSSNARRYFIVHELAGGLGDHPMLFSEVFRSEDVRRRELFYQKSPAFDYVLFLFGYG